MTTATCQKVREKVLLAMSAVPGPGTANDEGVVQRHDGVREFGREWIVRRDAEGAILSARLSDRDDVIEFGLLQRADGTAINVLYATLVLDDDEMLLNVVSEVDMDFNFDVKLSEGHLQPLHDALRFYASHVTGASAPLVR